MHAAKIADREIRSGEGAGLFFLRFVNEVYVLKFVGDNFNKCALPAGVFNRRKKCTLPFGVLHQPELQGLSWMVYKKNNYT